MVAVKFHSVLDAGILNQFSLNIDGNSPISIAEDEMRIWFHRVWCPPKRSQLVNPTLRFHQKEVFIGQFFRLDRKNVALENN